MPRYKTPMPRQSEIDQAIIDLYDAHVGIYGYDKNVFQITTAGEVARYLDIPQYLIALSLGQKANGGFSRYKQELLARRGRGSIACVGNICWFEPKKRDK